MAKVCYKIYVLGDIYPLTEDIENSDSYDNETHILSVINLYDYKEEFVELFKYDYSGCEYMPKEIINNYKTVKKCHTVQTLNWLNNNLKNPEFSRDYGYKVLLDTVVTYCNISTTNMWTGIAMLLVTEEENT